MISSIISHLVEVESQLYTYGPDDISQEEIKKIKGVLFYILKEFLRLDGTLPF